MMPIGIHSIITWDVRGPNPCRKCLALYGRQWLDWDLYAPTLDDAFFGPVYDLIADRSLAHPHCFCGIRVEVTVDLSEIPELSPLQGEI
jgi:hypothetical protein